MVWILVNVLEAVVFVLAFIFVCARAGVPKTNADNNIALDVTIISLFFIFCLVIIYTLINIR